MSKLSTAVHQPLVSIVVPSFNHANFVKATIQSVIEQDYENIELIIIDDGSTDKSISVINELAQDCIHRFKRFEFRHRANKGLCATLNEALALAHGEFFAPIASDDILKPYKTSIQVSYMQENPKCAGVFGGIEVIDEYGQTPPIGSRRPRTATKHIFKEVFLHKHHLPAPSQLLRYDVLQKINGYNEKFIIEDLSMWLAITASGYSLDYISHVFASYRRHTANTSKKFDKMMEGRLNILEGYKSHPDYHYALARTYMLSAYDWQGTDYKKSAALIKKAIHTNKKILLDESILIFLRNTAINAIRNLFK